jgi:hypothetical protein
MFLWLGLAEHGNALPDRLCLDIAPMRIGAMMWAQL